MKKSNFLKYAALLAFVVAIGFFAYMVHASKALSYLSSDPKACINCHVMNTQYATWQHSSHAQRAGCIDCHLPHDNIVNKYIAKARDGYNHSVAFTFNTYKNAIKISDDGAKRVQENCISCHASLTSQMVKNADGKDPYTREVENKTIFVLKGINQKLTDRNDICFLRWILQGVY